MSTPSKNTTLLPLTRQKVKNLCKTIKKKLSPWRSFKFHSVNITDFYGETYPIGGGDMAYEGTVVLVFFNFIIPFLEDAIVNTLDETLEICRSRGLKPEEPYIRETAKILDGYLIDPIYREMADIDRYLRSRDGNLRSVKRRNVTYEIDTMVKFLDKSKDELIQGIKEQNGMSNQPQGKAGQDNTGRIISKILEWLKTWSELNEPKTPEDIDRLPKNVSPQFEGHKTDMNSLIRDLYNNGAPSTKEVKERWKDVLSKAEEYDVLMTKQGVTDSRKFGSVRHHVHQLIMTLEKAAQEKAGQGKTESKEQTKKLTKLTDFIINCCEDTPSVSSKVNRIHEFVKKRKIKFMPKTVNKPERNETKLYYEDELRQVWPKLKEKIKSLPNLKD